MKKQDDLYEKTLASKTIYEGKIITVKVDDVLLPNGKQGKREIVHHQGAVAVLALTEENKMVAVRQFRKPLEATIVEIPAGKLERGEEPLECAKRELWEETGYTAQSFTLISSFYTSPGFADELIHLYLATGLQEGEQKPDEDEFVEVMLLSLQEAQELHRQGMIKDAKTVLAMYVLENLMLKNRE